MWRWMMDRIEEIKKRLRAASLGPWSRVKSLTSKYWTIGRIVSHAAIPSDNESDWDFIEHACEDIPYLLSEVERLGAIETNVRGIIPFLERHLQEILEVKDTPRRMLYSRLVWSMAKEKSDGREAREPMGILDSIFSE